MLKLKLTYSSESDLVAYFLANFSIVYKYFLGIIYNNGLLTFPVTYVYGQNTVTLRIIIYLTCTMAKVMSHGHYGGYKLNSYLRIKFKYL